MKTKTPPVSLQRSVTSAAATLSLLANGTPSRSCARAMPGTLRGDARGIIVPHPTLQEIARHTPGSLPTGRWYYDGSDHATARLSIPVFAIAAILKNFP
jgi:hypothetical protein